MKRFLLCTASLPWPVQGLLVCAAFLVVGTAVVDDYGVGFDTMGQEVIAKQNLAFIMGDIDRRDAPEDYFMAHDKYYGIVFELPLLLLERGLEWEDPRNFYLMRHLVTHGFFLVGGWCCSLLVFRLSNSRGPALLALLLFVMSPRLYAHSFFNSKDLPFLSMFMIALYLTHRAFRKDTVGAFLLCGVSVGILTNLRIMGMMLFAAVLALRGLDLVQANGEKWKHVLVTGAVFALAGPCTLYALSPYLWTDPFEFVTALQTLASHPTRVTDELFQGELIDSHHLPWHFIPTWVGISTPPVTLLLGGLGAALVGGRCVRRTGEALRNTDLRFGLLLLVCLTLPVVAVVILGAHHQDTWRHMFFLHAPLCSLGGWGCGGVGGRWPGMAERGGYALAGIGVLATVGEMVRLHPHQHVYFNVLVDRTTPEALRTSYVLDPWMISCREALDFLRRRYPDTTVSVESYSWITPSWMSLPGADRIRLERVEENPDVRILCGKSLQNSKELSLENALYVRKVYNNTLLTITGVVTVPDRERSLAYRTESYRGVTAGRVVQRAKFDLYRYGASRRLGYAKDGCTGSDVSAPFFLHMVPKERADLPASRLQYGFDNLDFTLNALSWRWEKERCYNSVLLPDYPISSIRTGQYTEQGQIWKIEMPGRFLDSGGRMPERK